MFFEVPGFKIILGCLEEEAENLGAETACVNVTTD